MKFLKYIFFTVLFAGLTWSCEEELELFPTDQKIPEFNRMVDFEQTLVGAYNSIQAATGGVNLQIDAWTADDMNISPQNNGQGAFLHQWTFSSDDGTVAGIWSRWYTTVRRANLVILNAGNLDDPALDQMVGEALGIRAFSHMQLYMTVGERYGDGSSLGIPYANTLDVEIQPARLTSEETMDLIEADILEAKALIGDDFDPFRINQVFLDGLLARVSMYRQDWNEVVQRTTAVIDNPNAPALSDIGSYAAMWDGTEADGENIFKSKFLPGDGTIGDVFWIISLNAPYFNPSQEIIDALSTPAKDVRLDLFIDQDLNRVDKYIGPASNPNLADAKIMRMSEMYLLRAEANAELGNNAAAQADLNTIRANRIAGFTPVNDANVLEAVRVERRKELCFEGYRLFDLKRWNLPIERGPDCTQDRCTLPADDFRMVFPIPQAEIFANDNIQQNPGY